MRESEIATYEQKVAHVKVVAQRGAEAREMAEDAGQTDFSEEYARKVFNAMAAARPDDGVLGEKVLVLSDTPADRVGSRYSQAWANHVRDVFAASFVAAAPRPKPPAA